MLANLPSSTGKPSIRKAFRLLNHATRMRSYRPLAFLAFLSFFAFLNPPETLPFMIFMFFLFFLAVPEQR